MTIWTIQIHHFLKCDFIATGYVFQLNNTVTEVKLSKLKKKTRILTFFYSSFFNRIFNCPKLAFLKQVMIAFVLGGKKVKFYSVSMVHASRLSTFYVVDMRNNSWQYLMLVGRQ